MGKRSQSKSGSNSDDSVRNIVENAGRFKAFISYSHEDFRDAARLHKRLENYALPKHLRSLDADDPLSAKGRLGRFFRDREDLPAAQDLTESVKQALAASKALIILCSPDARASPWVTREVQLFQELHPDRPILAAILRGEPDQSIPEILRQGGEPLAADLRKEGDGARLGFLKIVAGLAEVPLDALIQRDTQRHLRRVTAVTVMALAAMLVMALMTTIALQARNEAQRQREGAEGLVEFMLSELREDLHGIAGVAVVEKVNRRALSYYDNHTDLNSLEPESLERRAKVIGQLGLDALNRKRFDLARQNFTERARITKGLLSQDFGHPDRRFNHALSLNQLGLLAEAEGEFEKSGEWLTQSWALLESIKAWEHGNDTWNRLSALVAGNLCAIDVLSDKTNQQTIFKCQLAVRIGGDLAKNSDTPSGEPYELAFNMMWLSEALSQLNHISHAGRMRFHCLALTDRLAEENPENLKILSQRMEIYGYLSRHFTDIKRSEMLQVAIRLAENLIQRDPDMSVWQDNLAHYQQQVGE